jgi:hypothetical protein
MTTTHGIAKKIGIDKNLPVAKDYNSTVDFVKASTNYYDTHPSISAIRSIKPLALTRYLPRLPALVAASSPLLAAVFNAIVRTSCFPQDSKHADVVPGFEKDNPLLHKNYRPLHCW